MQIQMVRVKQAKYTYSLLCLYLNMIVKNMIQNIKLQNVIYTIMARTVGNRYTVVKPTTLSAFIFHTIEDVSFTCGNGQSGKGKFKNIQSGSHPCFASNTSSRSSGTVCFTCFIQLLKKFTDSSFPAPIVSNSPKYQKSYIYKYVADIFFKG